MSRKGFTLIEILIASVIFLFLVIALYSTYSQVIKTKEITSFKGEEEFYIRLFMQRLNQELSSMLFNPQCLASSFRGDENTISFYTVSPSLYYPANPFTYVSYFFEKGRIYRQEEPYLSLKKESKKFSVLEDVEEIEFSYFDGEIWRDKWEKEDTLPLRIKVKIEVRGIPYSTSFYLPLGGKVEG